MSEKIEASPADIVHQMMEKDAFSKWLGISVLEIEAGYSRLALQVEEDMLNGFGIAHGGITYSLADSALAFAANSRGRIALSTLTTIAHLEKVVQGDLITAETKELQLSPKSAHYFITIKNQNETIVATFSGSVHLTSKNWTRTT